jgi:hypothetical protein
LFGQSPYERDSAPEPELLIDLAPVLDSSLLPYAYRTIRDIAFMRGADRLRGLIQFLDRAGVEASPWSSYLGESLRQYPDLAEAVPAHLVPPALRAIESLQGHDERRVMALLALSKRLEPGGEQQAATVIRREVEYLTDALATDPSLGPPLLLVLADTDSSITEEVCERVLSSIEGLKDAGLKARLYGALLGHAAGKTRTLAQEKALEAARGITPDARRALVLVTLSDQLSGADRGNALGEVLSIARKIKGLSPARMEVFAELTLRSPQLDRAKVLEIIRTEPEGKTAALSAETALAEAFASISPNVPESLQDSMREAVRGLRLPEYTLGDLARFLSDQQLRGALARAVKLMDKPFGPEAQLLSVLAPHLSEELLSDAVRAAADIPSHREDLQARILLALAPQLTARVALEAAAVAQKMESLWWKGRTLGALLSRLPGLYQRELIPLIERVNPDHMCSLLNDLAYSDHVELLTQTMDTVWDHFGGGPPPAEVELEPEEREKFEAPIDATQVEEKGKLERRSPHAEEPQVGSVVTGFALRSDPGCPLPAHMPLERSTDYLFWVEVGSEGRLPERFKLQVVLYPFPEGIRVQGGALLGELEIRRGGETAVTRQPASLTESEGESPLTARRIFFPVQTPKRAGTYRLQCGIYYRQLLVQSRTMRIRVMASPKKDKKALRSALDYNLTHSLGPQDPATAPHRLSVMLNDNGNGSHSLRFFGEGPFTHNVHLDDQELQALIEQARGALRKAAWGDEEEWKEGKAYRYSGASDPARLGKDLARLAVRGSRFYEQVFDSRGLADRMRSPGLVQIAFASDERLVIPSALLYDHPLDTAVSEHDLCGAFLEALETPGRLEESPCFQGRCPNYAQGRVVCPGGFWGFRHDLGMPLSIGNSGSAAPSVLACGDSPEMLMGVFTDFELLGAHRSQLQEMAQANGWNLQTGEQRAQVISMLQERNPRVVYFYCHGGMRGSIPYIRVGSPGERGISRDNIRNSHIRWERDRPLVFINGCHTTALQPHQALRLLGAFVSTANASGVIGAEIPAFEPLAGRFAEQFLLRFWKGEPVGKAVREARLALLKDGNPLGLIYTPFALADLRLAFTGSPDERTGGPAQSSSDREGAER